MMAVENNIKSRIKGCMGDNTPNMKEKWWFFIKWYCNTSKEDRTKENWENSGEFNSTGKIGWEGTKDWLLNEDFQNGLKEYIKLQRSQNILNIYESMYDKALNGDVRCADWVRNFYESDWFGDSEDELNDILNGASIDED